MIQKIADFHKRLYEFQHDSFINFMSNHIAHASMIAPQKWLIKNGHAEPIPNDGIEKLREELNGYILSKYSDLINGQ